ncbi:MAG: anthranilate synthase component I family protein [Myxococcota bacterium]
MNYVIRTTGVSMPPKQIQIHTECKQELADMITPVGIYLRLRDHFPYSILLESMDNQPNQKSFSYICCDPIASFRVENEALFQQFLEGPEQATPINERAQVCTALRAFLETFSVKQDNVPIHLYNGLFGYMAYDSIRYFEDITLQAEKTPAQAIPDLQYHAYRYILAIDHHKNQLFLQKNHIVHAPQDKVTQNPDTTLSLEAISALVHAQDTPTFPFELRGETTSNFEDHEYLTVVEQCKQHIQRGDVFQIVPSRRFCQAFRGDEFNLYRALRAINPSPYLFYFDCGNFKIFGSSPEAQLVVQGSHARLFPIAGTYKRTGNEEVDQKAIRRLHEDPKENAEHVMLVDLARNDLSRHCTEVLVESYKQIQRYSHVIHLTSEVVGTLEPDAHPIDLLASTFPMGTLSGAPKHRAMQIIDRLERGRRHTYGGAIGLLGFDHSCHHAIVIRSFLSKDNQLFFQAGGGIVSASKPEDELQEINNKLGALNAALQMATQITR